MSVQRLYSCDLCHGMIGGLIGIYWEPGKDGEKLVFRPARSVEYHLCGKCLSELREADLPPKETNPDFWL